jgi:hypothetical protein
VRVHSDSQLGGTRVSVIFAPSGARESA